MTETAQLSRHHSTGEDLSALGDPWSGPRDSAMLGVVLSVGMVVLLIALGSQTGGTDWRLVALFSVFALIAGLTRMGLRQPPAARRRRD